jgi:hypothetical protein
MSIPLQKIPAEARKIEWWQALGELVACERNAPLGAQKDPLSFSCIQT